MKWFDLFYFSKGERRALILLLFLIVGAWITVVFTRRDDSSQIMYAASKDNVAMPDTGKAVKNAVQPVIQNRKKERREFYKPWVGPKKNNYSYTKKYPKGTIVEINAADTTVLKGVPGIGSSFANRIVKYRNLLGGFCHIEQLKEVYGIDNEKFALLKDWFRIDTALIRKIRINDLPAKELSSHPYISFAQAEVILKLRKRKGKIKNWDELRFMKEFGEDDYIRLCSYVSFDSADKEVY